MAEPSAVRPRGTDEAPVRVLYVAGTGRSGSTLVSTVLGQLEGVAAVGELRYLWARGVEADQLCGCGEPFSRCALWREVVEGVEQRTGGPVDAPALAGRLHRRTRVRRLPGIVGRRLRGLPSHARHADDDALVGLYRSVRRATGARVVVDSSKLPTYGMLLDGLPGVEVTVLHLVRDPRAAAWSWLRLRSTRQRDDDPPMDRLHPVKSAVLWTLWNAVTAATWPPSSSSSSSSAGARSHLRLRYEDVVRDPVAALGPVVRALGADPADLPFVDRGTVRLATTHAVAGNPSRRVVGDVVVHDDDEWRQGLRRGHRLVVSAITAPARLLVRGPRGVVARPEEVAR